MRRTVATLLVLLACTAGCTDDEDRRSFAEPNAMVNAETDAGDDNDAGQSGEDAGANAVVEMPEVRSWVVGRSALNRPLVVEMYGDEGPVLYLLSSIHGDERLAYTFAERIRTTLLSGLAERNDIRIFFFQIGNPDGVVEGTRENIREVDLNRNFPADNFDPSAGGGDEPLSEPESVAIHDTVGWVDPSAVISVHCCAPTLDWDGPGEPLAETMSQAMDPAIAFPTVRLGSRPGSFGSLIGVDLQRPIVTVEFALGNGEDPQEQLDSMVAAIEAAAVWTARNGTLPVSSPEEAIVEEPINGYAAFTLGRSASGTPLRGDRAGFDGSNTYVVSGLDGDGFRGEYVAEHLRTAALLRYPPQPGEGIWFVTGASPDALAFGGRANAAEGDVWNDIATSGTATPEGRALFDWLGAVDPGTVWWFEDAAGPVDANRVTVHGSGASRFLGRLDTEDSSALAAAYRPIVESLVDLGHTVVVVEIGEDYFEAQGISEENPDWEPSRESIWSERIFDNL